MSEGPANLPIGPLLDGIRIPWRVAATGDMTLCVLDASGNRILRVDLLRHGTMRAGDGGERLARTYNDLFVIAALPDIVKSVGICPGRGTVPPHPEAEISPLPWRLLWTPKRANVVDATGCIIADISWRNKPGDVLLASLDVIDVALPLLSGTMAAHHDE